jgi:hypothetical protein
MLRAAACPSTGTPKSGQWIQSASHGLVHDPAWSARLVIVLINRPKGDWWRLARPYT